MVVAGHKPCTGIAKGSNVDEIKNDQLEDLEPDDADAIKGGDPSAEDKVQRILERTPKGANARVKQVRDGLGA